MGDEGEPLPPPPGARAYDVNGRLLGRVRSLDAQHGTVAIELTDAARRRFQVAARRLDVPLEDFVDSDNEDATLREEGLFVTHPELQPSRSVTD